GPVRNVNAHSGHDEVNLIAMIWLPAGIVRKVRIEEISGVILQFQAQAGFDPCADEHIGQGRRRAGAEPFVKLAFIPPAYKALFPVVEGEIHTAADDDIVVVAEIADFKSQRNPNSIGTAFDRGISDFFNKAYVFYIHAGKDANMLPQVEIQV